MTLPLRKFGIALFVTVLLALSTLGVYQTPYFESGRMAREIKNVRNLVEAEQFAAKYGLEKYSQSFVSEDTQLLSFYLPEQRFSPVDRTIKCDWLLERGGRALSFRLVYSRRALWKSKSTIVRNVSGVPN